MRLELFSEVEEGPRLPPSSSLPVFESNVPNDVINMVCFILDLFIFFVKIIID